MLVISQFGSVLFNTDSAILAVTSNGGISIFDNTERVLVGKYASNDRAKEVLLDMFESGGCKYYMPKA